MKMYLGIVWFAIAACGGDDDSGIDESKKLNALSSSEVTAFCEWAIAEQGGAGRETMCGDLIIKVQTQAQCEAQYGAIPDSCTATVGNAETCARALSADPCSLGGDACEVVFTCSASATAFGTISAP